MVKNLPADAEDEGLISGIGRSSGEANATLPTIPAWETPWTEEPVGLHPWGGKESDTTQQLNSYNNAIHLT